MRGTSEILEKKSLCMDKWEQRTKCVVNLNEKSCFAGNGHMHKEGI